MHVLTLNIIIMAITLFNADCIYTTITSNIYTVILINTLILITIALIIRRTTLAKCKCPLCSANYTVEAPAFEGGFSKVYKVISHANKQIYALKSIPVKDITHAEKFRNEAKRLNDVKDCKHIVHYQDDFIHVECKHLLTKYYFNIVTEYCSNGDLADLIYSKRENDEPFSVIEKSKIVAQLVDAIKAVHTANIVHRDIKSPNIFVTECGDYKLGDLGLSILPIKHHKCIGRAGTEAYMAPEMLSEISGPSGKECDIWCLGLVFLELETLVLTWEYKDVLGEIGAKYINNPFEFMKRLEHTIPEHSDKHFRSLLKLMLHPKYSERISINEMLKHPYIKKARSHMRSEFKTPGSMKKCKKIRFVNSPSTRATDDLLKD